MISPEEPGFEKQMKEVEKMLDIVAKDSTADSINQMAKLTKRKTPE